jgi:prepilin-type N-terminal cleavage/methylation domain-containing protein
MNPKQSRPWNAKASAGFTIIELLVVIAIIAILAAMCTEVRLGVSGPQGLNAIR